MTDTSSLANHHARKIAAIEMIDPNLFRITLRGKGSPALLVRVRGNKGYGFMPELSHFVRASGAGGPHRPSFHPSNSPEEALGEAITHGLMLYDPTDEGATWETNPNFE